MLNYNDYWITFYCFLKEQMKMNKSIQFNDEMLFDIDNMLKPFFNLESITVIEKNNHQYITTHTDKDYLKWLDSLSDDFINQMKDYYFIDLYDCYVVFTNHSVLNDSDKEVLFMSFDILYHLNDFQTNKNQVYLFKKILNRIQANVCISNPFTNKIIYMNDYMKEAYQVENPEGQVCWNVLRKNQDHRCDNCPIPYLCEYPNEVYKCENVNPFNKINYRSYDYIIETIDGEMAHFQYAIDITDADIAKKEASIDTLTGITNRKKGFELIKEQLSQAKKKMKNVHICMFDVNHLKYVNDSYGHHEGDVMLKTIVQTIKEQIEPWDIFMRLSGDEFIMTFYDCSIEQVHDVLKKVSNCLSSNNQNQYKMSFCYGIYTVLPTNELSLEEIIMEADKNMYEQKRLFHLKEKQNQNTTLEFDYDKNLLYDALIHSTDDYIFICNMKTGVFRYPPKMVEEFNLPSEVIQNAIDVLDSKIHQEDKAHFLDANQLIIDGKSNSHVVEFRALNKKNEWIWLRCQGQVEYDENNQPVLFAGFMTNLGKKYHRDVLTGLQNQVDFEKDSQQMTTPYTMMILNIDNFKDINNLYSRDFGDYVLQVIAKKIKKVVNSQVKIYKLESDEFGLLFKGQDIHYATSLFNQIQDYMNKDHFYEGHSYIIHFTVGICFALDSHQTYLELRKNTAIALQYGKRYHQQITLYTDNLLEKEKNHLLLFNALKNDIMNHFEHFSLAFQPKIRCIDNQLISFESLCRWNNPYFPRTGPDTFIPILESSRDIIELGLWVFEESLKKLKEWKIFYPSLTMSINVSYVQLIENSFIDDIQSLIKKYNINPYDIIIELTETSVAQNIDFIIHQIRQLRDIGIKIAMDDFGTGYSSLSLLRDEPLDIIKIDRSFVQGIKEDHFNLAFIQFIIQLCHQLPLKIVVEGVETKDDLDTIKVFKPDYIQGYYISKPMDEYKASQYIQTFQKNSPISE